MRDNPSSAMTYICDDNHSYIIRMIVNLKKEISYEALRWAVDTAVKRYPYFALKIEHMSDDTELVFVPNDREIPIFDHIGAVMLASEQTNYHIQAVSYSGNTICFDICHGFADGSSLTEWAKTVLYYYIEKKYNTILNKKNIKTLDDEITDEEYLDPIKPYVDMILNKPMEEMAPIPSKKPARIKDYYTITPDSKNVRFWVNSKDFMRVAKSNDGTPTSFVIALLAKLLNKKKKSVELSIVVDVAKDLRAGLGVKESHHPTVIPFSITYPRRALDYDVEMLSTMARGRFILMQDEDGLKTLVNNFATSCALSLMLPDIKSKCHFNTSCISGLNENNTFAISYTGQKNFGSVEEYIDTIYLQVTNDASDLMIELFSVGDKLCFSFMQTFKENDLVLDLISYLEKNGVAVHGFESDKLIYPKVKI